MARTGPGRRAGSEGTVAGDGELARGREAGQQLAWADAYTALSVADQSTSLAGGDLELLASAAYLLGHAEECRQALQRAHPAAMLTAPQRPGRRSRPRNPGETSRPNRRSHPRMCPSRVTWTRIRHPHPQASPQPGSSTSSRSRLEAGGERLDDGVVVVGSPRWRGVVGLRIPARDSVQQPGDSVSSMCHYACV